MRITTHPGVVAYIKQIGSIQRRDLTLDNPEQLSCKRYSPEALFLVRTVRVIFPDGGAHIEKAKAEGDSLGGIVELIAFGVPAGLGDPVYEKLEANLAHAMLSTSCD